MRGFCLHVSGGWACYTRPECKVERVSYEVPTPTVVRSIFEAILWKPAINWVPDGVRVLNPIRWMNTVTNEVPFVRPDRGSLAPVLVADRIQQRNNRVLRDVSYLFFAHFELRNRGLQESTQVEAEAKYASMFQRRASKGKSFHVPYLGQKDYPCDFELVENPEKGYAPIAVTKDLGLMFHSWSYDSEGNVPEDGVSPRFFQAKMEDGSVWFPNLGSGEVF